MTGILGGGGRSKILILPGDPDTVRSCAWCAARFSWSGRMPPAIWTTWHQLRVKKSENLNEVMILSFHLQTVCNSQNEHVFLTSRNLFWEIPTLTQTATSNRSTANPTTLEPPSSLLLPLHLVPSLPLDPPVPRDLNANLSGLDEGPRGLQSTGL